MKKEKGFTLLEVMIAFLILSTALVAVFQLQAQSLAIMEEVQFLTTASLLAQSKMAEIEAMEALNLEERSGNFGDDYPDFEWVVEVKDTMIPSLKKIHLSVRNRNLKSRNTYELELYKLVEG